MTTIYGFKRPDGSVVVDTLDCDIADARFGACNDWNGHATWSVREKEGYTIKAFTLSPDGTISPRKE